MAYMKEHGWNIELDEMQSDSLPEAITGRYANRIRHSHIISLYSFRPTTFFFVQL